MVEEQYQFFNLVQVVFERILVSSAPGLMITADML